MSSFELTGKIIEKNETQKIKDTFSKREFVLEVFKEISGSQYSDFVKFQLTNQKCELLNNFQVGNDVKVLFNIRGNKWTRQDGTIGYITNLEAWKIDAAGASNSAPASAPVDYAASAPAPSAPKTEIVSDGANDDLPF